MVHSRSLPQIKNQYDITIPEKYENLLLTTNYMVSLSLSLPYLFFLFPPSNLAAEGGNRWLQQDDSILRRRIPYASSHCLRPTSFHQLIYDTFRPRENNRKNDAKRWLRKWLTQDAEVASDENVESLHASEAKDRRDLRRIPFKQRVTRPRVARRMNHPFKYLYRHGFTGSIDPIAFLETEGGYSVEEIRALNESFPMLLQLSVPQQLHPKLQFLKQTLHQSQPSHTFDRLPAFYFGSRLERIIAPRHAFLVWSGLPSGPQLFEPISHGNASLSSHLTSSCRFQEFLLASRTSKHFAALCQNWYDAEICKHGDTTSVVSNSSFVTRKVFTAKDVEAFDAIFGRGLLAAVRNDLVQANNTWALDQLPTLCAAEIVRLLIQHGANVHERDHRGATLLHWACGTGNWDIVEHLLPYFRDICNTVTTRDGATPLHWAAAGCNTREFGIGGHAHVCSELLWCIKSNANGSGAASSWNFVDFVNRCTFDGNSPLMWAAWSGTLETVKLLVRNKADTNIVNRNGCSVAHWAASGGNLAVCRYLHDIAMVDFRVTNYGGNTPVSHAVAFGRTDVVQWLLQILKMNGDCNDEGLARSLAHDFVEWTHGEDHRRKNILQLFYDTD
jgi:Ankyrin repeats (3 copies)